MLDFIYNRVSVRKFTNEPVKDADLEEILKAMTYAPSGKNLQNWHVVVVKNRETIQEMVTAVEKKNRLLASAITDEKAREQFEKFAHYATLFHKAPMTVLFYAGPYPATAAQELEDFGDLEGLAAVNYAAPGIQSVAAGIENFMLAAAALGYGTCWMTSPNYAAREIEKVIDLDKEGYHLIAMTPLGVPEKQGSHPARKALEEVVTYRL